MFEELCAVGQDDSLPSDKSAAASSALEGILKHASFMGPAGYKVWKALHLMLDVKPATKGVGRSDFASTIFFASF